MEGYHDMAKPYRGTLPLFIAVILIKGDKRWKVAFIKHRALTWRSLLMT